MTLSKDKYGQGYPRKGPAAKEWTGVRLTEGKIDHSGKSSKGKHSVNQTPQLDQIQHRCLCAMENHGTNCPNLAQNTANLVKRNIKDANLLTSTNVRPYT